MRYDIQFLPDPIEADGNNVAPRIGLAYAPGDRKTVIRAGYGIYFDRIPLRATSNALQRDGTKYKVATLAFGQAGAPVFPNVTATFPPGFLPSITTIDTLINNAYSQQASLQIERELSSDEVWRRVVNGFQLSYIFSYGSALPFNVVTGTDRNNDTTVNDRPVGVGRNTGIGFDYASFDLRLSRRIRFTERVVLEVMAEGFNLFNRTNLQLPNNTFGPGSTPLSGFRRPTGAADPRQIQFGLRLHF